MSQSPTGNFVRTARNIGFGWKFILGPVILALFVFAGWKLSVAPFYAAMDEAGCRREYAGAMTQGDTNRVDLLPYRERADGPRQYCVKTRAVVVSGLGK